MSRSPQIRINLRLSQAQHDALVALSEERDLTVQHLIRSGIAAVTSVPDEVGCNRRYRRTDP